MGCAGVRVRGWTWEVMGEEGGGGHPGMFSGSSDICVKEGGTPTAEAEGGVPPSLTSMGVWCQG